MSLFCGIPARAGFVFVVAIILSALTSSAKSGTVDISNTDPRIYFHGRWDKSPGTWWCVFSLNCLLLPSCFKVLRAGSGFKLHAKNLDSLTLHLGPHTTAPLASVGVSVDYQDFFTVNVSEGANPIPLDSREATVVRINVEGWQNNRINLEKITVNEVGSRPLILGFPDYSSM